MVVLADMLDIGEVSGYGLVEKVDSVVETFDCVDNKAGLSGLPCKYFRASVSFVSQ